MTPTIHLIETLSMNAWPAELAEPLDGWWLRWHRAPSRRVNSVWPNGWGGQIPLAIKLEKVAFFYALRGQPARFQICPAAQPEGLDAILETQGYIVDAVTAVQVSETAHVLAQTPFEQTYEQTEIEIQVFDAPSETWLEGYRLTQNAPLEEKALRREALERIPLPGVYVLVRVNGAEAAVGHGVLEQGWLGVFGMTTRQAFRRKGLATKILRVLAAWGQAHGAAQMYLQVMENNSGAKRLYENVGFRTLYHYHYREQTLFQ